MKLNSILYVFLSVASLASATEGGSIRGGTLTVGSNDNDGRYLNGGGDGRGNTSTTDIIDYDEIDEEDVWKNDNTDVPTIGNPSGVPSPSPSGLPSPSPTGLPITSPTGVPNSGIDKRDDGIWNYEVTDPNSGIYKRDDDNDDYWVIDPNSGIDETDDYWAKR